jgi:TRAP transporter TAXI family solute receptor
MTALKRIKYRHRVLAALIAMSVGISLTSFEVQAGKRFVAIGTGGPTGVYFVVGNAICRMVQKAASQKKTDLHCSAPATGGSVYNINAIRTGDLDLGVVQSDVQQHAYQGTDEFEGKPFDKIRALFSVHAEPFQILVGKDSGIHSWADLAGKRVNIGNPGSGQRGTFEALMLANNVDGSFFGTVSELSSTEQSKALCDGKIDAYGYTVGVPNAGVAQAANGCGARIIALQGKTIDRLVADNPYYAYSTIPKGTYKTIENDVSTFGVMATIVVRDDVSQDKVYDVVRAVFENLAEFRKLHPAFAHLDEKKMISDGLSVPLHTGAVKYYKEKGWIE